MKPLSVTYFSLFILVSTLGSAKADNLFSSKSNARVNADLLNAFKNVESISTASPIKANKQNKKGPVVPEATPSTTPTSTPAVANGASTISNADGTITVTQSSGLDFGRPVVLLPFIKLKGANNSAGENAFVDATLFSGVGAGFSIGGQTTEEGTYTKDKGGNLVKTSQDLTNKIDFSTFLAIFLDAQLNSSSPSTTSISIGAGLGLLDNQIMIVPTYDLGNVPDGRRFSVLLSTSIFSPR